MQFDGTQLLVSQILLHVKQEPTRTEKQTLALAENLLARIREREITFAEAARQFSDSPTGQKGGIVGLIEFNGAMPREFNTAAFKLKPGEISEPIKTAFGYHLIKLNNVTPGTITWQMARPSLRKALIAHLLNFLTEEGRKISTVELSEDWK
jgi:parvulin-like peptidyl-prolyl isomerase